MFRGCLLATSLAALVVVQPGSSARAYASRDALPRCPRAPSAYELICDLTPLAITITEAWEKVAVTLPADVLVSSRPLWRKMHLDDWDRVPAPYRDAALEAMVREYGWATGGPEIWQGMGPIDWDGVPQPVRAVAFIMMARHWCQTLGVGRGRPAGQDAVADTLGAILATESWFEHRAVNENPAGDRDLGVGQSSAFCRRVLRKQSAARRLDCAYEDSEYGDPWKASHAAAVWFGLMLEEANGDVALAVRAYHRGIGQARRGAAAAYLQRVIRHRRWVDGSYAGSPTWCYLTAGETAVSAAAVVARGTAEPR